MNFELLLVLELIFDFYEKPRTFKKFQDYLNILQGETKGDLKMPISGFNPMAKEHILQKLSELKALEAEKLIEKTLAEINLKLKDDTNNTVFKVAFNLSDDLKGGWTNRFSTDYDSKFKINALVSRNFCVPVFWTSEDFSKEIVTQRTSEYVFRTVYQSENPRPKTLKEHIEQEKFVAINTDAAYKNKNFNFDAANAFYKKNQESDNYNLIFNFFYGDNASHSLGFPIYGINEAHRH